MSATPSIDIFNRNENDKRMIQEFGNVTIENNAIYYDQTSLQISNISRTWIGKFEKTPFPQWPIIGIVIGLILVMLGIFIIGLVITAACGLIIYSHFNNKKDRFGLQIEMNSGFLAIFSSHDNEFLCSFQNAITTDFIERSGSTEISMDNRTIIDNKGAISYGENSTNTIKNQV